jgi:hypothetical protein
MTKRRPARRHDDYDEGGATQSELVFGLGGLVLLAFGAFVWNVYAGAPPPRIAPSSPHYKSRPPEPIAPEPQVETSSLDAVLAGQGGEIGAVEPREGPEQPALAPASRPQLTPAPTFAADGAYVAQLAALQSEEAVAPAWNRLASRAPQLFAAAALDVERADLGARGVYFRVRAGYFSDRENVGRFCDRIKAMGQDCIAVRR